MSNYTLTTTDKRSSRAGCAVVEDNDQGPLTTVVEKYEKDRSDLVRGMAFYYAPHLADRAFWTQRWWEKRQGWPEAHVSSPSTYVRGGSMLTAFYRCSSIY